MKLIPVLEEKKSWEGDIIITIPADTDLDTYKAEIAKVEQEGEIMNYKVNKFPVKAKIGNRCWVCYNKKIIGYMNICGFSTKSFICSTTGKRMEGNFIERSGKFNWLKEPFDHEPFRSFRYVDQDFVKNLTY